MGKLSVTDLKYKANDIRQDIIEMLCEAKSGHTAGPLGMADIFSALYFGGIMDYDPKNPAWPDRDRLVLSCGHINPVLYAAMAESGYFPKEELKTLRKINSRLQGHPHNLTLPGIENSSGPLAQGTSIAAGIALAFKLDKKTQRVYLITSDGEHEEGQTWEAVMLAGKYKLDNITAVLDRNKIQIDGNTEDIMPLDSLRAKYEAFNWNVLEIDGHNFEEIIGAYQKAKTLTGKPTMIIAHTTPGKGVSFAESDYKWHGIAPNQEQADKALKELKEAREND